MEIHASLHTLQGIPVHIEFQIFHSFCLHKSSYLLDASFCPCLFLHSTPLLLHHHCRLLHRQEAQTSHRDGSVHRSEEGEQDHVGERGEEGEGGELVELVERVEDGLEAEQERGRWEADDLKQRN
jgi:hypothetical protein